MLGDAPPRKGEKRRLKASRLPEVMNTVIDGSGTRRAFCRGCTGGELMLADARRLPACCVVAAHPLAAGTLWVGLLHWLSVASGTAAAGASTDAA